MFVTAVLLATALIRGPDPVVPRPRIHRMVIAADTVWFLAGKQDDSLPTFAYCFNRKTERWCRTTLPAGTGAVRPRAVALLKQQTPGRTVSIGAGWKTACAATAESCSPLRVANHGKTVIISERGGGTARLKTPFSTDVSSVAESHGIAWLGLGGGYSEGEGGRGGLIALDSATGTARWITQPALDSTSVTSLVADSLGLWLGVVKPGEYGPYGGHVLRYEPPHAGVAARWSRVTSRAGQLPGDVVLAVAAADAVVAVATADGLAVRTSDGRWIRRFYHLAVAGDSVVSALVTTGPDDLSDPRVSRLIALLASGRQQQRRTPPLPRRSAPRRP